MNAPAPANIPVIAIQQNDLWIMEQPDLMVEPFDALDEAIIFDIMAKIQPSSVIVIESDAFQECAISMRTFLRQIRKQSGEAPRILILRCKNSGKENLALAEGDKQAGANDVLWYQLSTSPKELTGKIGAFIRNGAISKLPAVAPIKSGPVRISSGIKVPPPSVKPARIINPTPPAIRQKQIIPPLVPKSDLPTWFSLPIRTPREDTDSPDGNVNDLIPPAEVSTGKPTLAEEKIQKSIPTLREESMREELLRTIIDQNNRMLALLEQLVPTPSKTIKAAVPSPPAGTATPTSKESPRIAIATKGGPFMANVSLFGKTIFLKHHSADLFAHLVNTGETISPADIASAHSLSYQGSYARISKLLEDLESFLKGLSSCLTPVRSGRSIGYRFDEVVFRKSLNIK